MNDRIDNGPALLLEAAAFAAERHTAQRRKAPKDTPYVNHPIQVAALLAVRGQIRDPEWLAAALLHDTIEDTATTGDEIEKRFGRAVRLLVEEVTDDKSLPKAERKQRRIEMAPRMSEAARQLKLADMACNLADMARHPPPDWSEARMTRYAAWAEAVAEGCQGVNPGLEAAFQESLIKVRRTLNPEHLPASSFPSFDTPTPAC